MSEAFDDRGVMQGVVEELLPLYALGELDCPNSIGPALPHRRRVIEAFELLKAALLPAGMSPEAVQPELLELFLQERLSRAFRLLSVEIGRALPFRTRGAYARHEAEQGHDLESPVAAGQTMAEAVSLTGLFLRQLPAIRRYLVDDIQAAYNGDPAALSFAEVMLTYPGVHAIASHRMAHELYLLDVPLVPRIMSEYTHATWGVDIHPGASIARSFFIDHASGVVIGETAVVGNNVKLYQGVTLGAKSFPLDEYGHPQKGQKRHPTVEDDVVIYSNASILGPVTIGRGSEIGGNVFLMHDVPPGSRVRQRAEIEVKEAVR